MTSIVCVAPQEPPGAKKAFTTGFNTGRCQPPVGRTGPTVAELADGPYFVLALLLDSATLCATDAACRLFQALNRSHVGPWRALGARAFHGLELEREGLFEHPVVASGRRSGAAAKQARVDWKCRFRRFCEEVPTFCSPFGAEIQAVTRADEVACLRCRLRTDILHEASAHGVYLEVEVLENPDNLSISVVDFEAGGCSSVTFSPDTGAVIREMKVREAPRKVEGAYIQPLPMLPPGKRFIGRLGLYLLRGRIAFVRRSALRLAADDEDLLRATRGLDGNSDPEVMAKEASLELGPWETTGFVSDLAWAAGRRLTPCLAFRDAGGYRVQIASVSTEPPLPIERNSGADGTLGWCGFDWNGAHHDPDGVEVLEA
mmetsp:Transcript_27250/g.71788  ORF Transcript_27250/g.71788 Transcript_27250/m.71788 type:complete len:373 (-) Transcript_27250:538-1656(-)|eukprot:CAMPEP_0194525080 /NCGR_PEP_ID=MMETSP0253-20130528/60417_1 /TAXON_ID=2966 /ORGANISM="Noctiluca scintillans" /LENGTH=372 /DNA_ID=CAMNT_0039369771 /DNA_START=28 /DNA_END=1146 /DNA_ORIENTATION=+